MHFMTKIRKSWICYRIHAKRSKICLNLVFLREYCFQSVCLMFKIEKKGTQNLIKISVTHNLYSKEHCPQTLNNFDNNVSSKSKQFLHIVSDHVHLISRHTTYNFTINSINFTSVHIQQCYRCISHHPHEKGDKAKIHTHLKKVVRCLLAHTYSSISLLDQFRYTIFLPMK